MWGNIHSVLIAPIPPSRIRLDDEIVLEHIIRDHESGSDLESQTTHEDDEYHEDDEHDEEVEV
jgi:hypothetical protein